MSNTRRKIQIFGKKMVFRLLSKSAVNYLRYKKFVRRLRKFKNISGKEFMIKFSPNLTKEMNMIPRLISGRKGDLLDIGANYGLYTFFFSKISKGDTRVFSFEPVKGSFKILCKIISSFKLKNTRPVNLALGQQSNKIQMVLPSNNTGLAHISNNNINEEYVESVEMSTLDIFSEKKIKRPINFIKCDVEGFELDVFKGGEKTIKKHKPIILSEIEERHIKKYGVSPNATMNLIRSFGYDAFIVNGVSLIKVTNVSGASGDYFFIPKNFWNKENIKLLASS